MRDVYNLFLSSRIHGRVVGVFIFVGSLLVLVAYKFYWVLESFTSATNFGMVRN
jgi:hypothetical protein